MAYHRYEWAWSWDAGKWFVTDAAAWQRDLLKKLEDETKLQLAKQEHIEAIESIRHEGVTYWTEWLGQLHRLKGTVKVVFIASSSPVEPITLTALLLAIIKSKIIWGIIAVVLAYLALKWLETVESTVRYIGEVAPEALGKLPEVIAGAAGLGIVLVLALLFWKPKEVKA